MESERTGQTPETTATGPNDASAPSLAASRRKLVSLILIAFVPIFIAYAGFFYFPTMAPKVSTNGGQLVTPPLQGESISNQLALQKSWVLIQPIVGGCDESCKELLYLSRQVTTGLGKDANRVSRVVLTGASLPDSLTMLLGSEHADIVMIEADISLLDGVTTQRPVLFLMDPNANVMMYFTLDQAGKPMLKDLKHLLKISNIG